jgi:hypothetical protein
MKIIIMKNETPKIIRCEIGPYPRPMPKGMFDEMPEVKVLLSDGEELTLFKFYPDEITISESELIGLNVDEAKRLKFEKDIRYLQC